MSIRIQRREFVAALGSAAAAWPLAGRGQQRERMRRIGVLWNLAADDPESSARLTAFVQGLQQSGWTDRRNVRIDLRWGAGDPELYRRYAMELVALAPDVILAGSGATVPALLQATRSIPIVFAQTPDPVAAGYVASLARPGGNATGFINFEFGLAGKWIELLKQIKPSTARVGVLRDVVNPSTGIPQFAAIQTVAPSLNIELTAIGVVEANEIEKGIKDFVRGPNDGLIVTATPLTAVHRDLIVAAAARYRLPAVYPFRYFTTAGGLISYGPDPIDQYRSAAGYVDRILRGEKPSELPVQAPTRYPLVINLVAAKQLGIEIPLLVRARADEVIE
jgi:putative ABC transport system substrate-binding protein